MATITIGEFLKECEAHPYSRERYEIVKESIEIDLMSLYLENYEYIKECKEYDEEIHESVMFTEATEGKESVKIDDSKINEAKEGFFKRIWRLIVRIFKKILASFNAMGTFFSRMIKKRDSDVNKVIENIKPKAIGPGTKKETPIRMTKILTLIIVKPQSLLRTRSGIVKSRQ